MKILTDRHQADLLYSLQLLFEDRLGVEVYVPVGLGWWEAGVWQFGACFGDDRLAQQYLVPWDGVWALQTDGTYLTYDGCHPERPIRGVTYEVAREWGWSFVMPTVQENQLGYFRFAEEVGARYLYEVGNTGQQIDWSLDPLALVAAEMEFPEGARAIRYHQEMDMDAYPNVAPYHADRNRVISFLNLFDRIDYQDNWTEFQRAMELGGFQYEVYGHEQANGFLQPVAAIGRRMAVAGFGWHDKPVGDGFGHVVHAWAAVGRPLVGHAEYYRGKMAEPFWQDGVTCFDLGARSLEDTVRLMRAVAANPEAHAEMCFAMQAAFDAAVDYEREAAEIAAFLGLA